MPGRHSFVLSLGFALFFFGSAVSRSQNCGPQEKESGVIRGTVVNSVTHAPIGRALITSPDGRFGLLTGSDGRFEFKLPSSNAQETNGDSGLYRPGSGPVEVVSRPIPFLGARKPGYLFSNANREYIAVGKCQGEVTIRLTPEAIIEGHVTLPSETYAGIQVELFHRHIQDGNARWQTLGTTTVRSDGGFRFAELPAGTYQLFTHEFLDRDPLTFNSQGQLYGYSPEYYSAAADFGSATPIQLSPGATIEATLAPKRREYYPVEIDVANAPQGRGMNLMVAPSGQASPGYALGYNGRQQKITGSLPDGVYTLEAFTYGQSPEFGDLTFTVAGAPVKGLTVALAPGASINLNVTEEFNSAEETGEGPQNVAGDSLGVAGQGQRRGRDVFAWLEPADEFAQRRGAWPRQPTGPNDDSIVLENVQPGRYWVRVNPSRGFVASLKCGQTDLLHHPLVVSGGGSAPIEVTLRDDGADVDGVVDNPRGLAGGKISGFYGPPDMEHVYFIPLPESAGQFRDVFVSPDGSFSANQIPPGDYRVLAFEGAQSELEFRNEAAMANYHAGEQVIRLLPGQKQHLNLHAISGTE